MATGDPALTLDGSEISFVLMLGRTRVASTQVLVETGEVAEKATMHEDKYLGVDRDRLAKRVRGFTWKIAGNMADETVITAIETRDLAIRAHQPAQPLSVQILLRKMDGTFSGFTLTGDVEAKWSFNAPGSDQRLKFSVDGMASEKAPAVA